MSAQTGNQSAKIGGSRGLGHGHSDIRYGYRCRLNRAYQTAQIVDFLLGHLRNRNGHICANGQLVCFGFSHQRANQSASTLHRCVRNDNLTADFEGGCTRNSKAAFCTQSQMTEQGTSLTRSAIHIQGNGIGRKGKTTPVKGRIRRFIAALVPPKDAAGILAADISGAHNIIGFHAQTARERNCFTLSKSESHILGIPRNTAGILAYNGNVGQINIAIEGNCGHSAMINAPHNTTGSALGCLDGC